MQLALAPGNDIHRIALVIDARGGVFFEEAAAALEHVGDERQNRHQHDRHNRDYLRGVKQFPDDSVARGAGREGIACACAWRW